jgi:hypothetical protein
MAAKSLLRKRRQNVENRKIKDFKEYCDSKKDDPLF